MGSSRRDSIKTASMFTAGSVLSADALAYAGSKVQASDKVRIALIGGYGQGWFDLGSFIKNPEVECVALCDVDQNVLAKRTKALTALGRTKPQLFTDYRKMLELKDIDVVIIGTPDHWHCLQLVDTVESGKHVYCEKPVGNSIAEISIMQKAANKANKMVQVGQWLRSHPHFADAINFVRSGKLGRIRATKAWSFVYWEGPVTKAPDSPVPDGINYDLWLGPAPTRAFNNNRFHTTWRWYWEYGNGLMSDWGINLIDFILFGIGRALPESVMTVGGKYAYPDDARVSPDTMTAVYDFGDFTLTCEHTVGIGLGNWKRPLGMAFIGEKGTLVLDRRGWEVFPEMQRMEAVPFQKSVGNGLDIHVKNFLDCLKNNTPQNLTGNIASSCNVAIAAQMANIALRSGEKVFWDDSKQKFTSANANKFITPVYNNGYKLPKY